MSASDRNPVEELAEEFLARRRRGERPQVSEYAARYPQWAEEIEDVFPTLLVVEDFKPGSADLTNPSAATGECEQQPKVLGDYRIMREVGRGGMGIVYEAEQMSLARRVALKVLPAIALSDSRHQRRFYREARAAGRLHHTNIVPVFGVGQSDGTHYYVMQFIHGQGLDKVLVELRRLRSQPGAEQQIGSADLFQAAATASPAEHPPAKPAGAADPTIDTSHRLEVGSDTDPESTSATALADAALAVAAGESRSRPVQDYWRSVARVGLQAADALAYAHGQGVLHRDIKPANLLLDTHGAVWITDFGLAKLNDHEDLTHTGDIIGTLRYMPPELFRRAGSADGRSDLYSLGLTLYELLALRPAFDAADRSQLMRQVMEGDPPRLRTVNPAIPRDLETIIHKAIEAEPRQRYQNAAELAEDLQRFVNDEPILARPNPWYERAWRWARRHPGVAALGLLLMSLLITAASVSFVAAGVYKDMADKRQIALTQESQARSEAERARSREAGLRRKAATLADQRRQQLYAAQMQLAQRELENANIERVLELLDTQRPGPGQSDLRGFEWGYLWQLCHSERQTLHGHHGPVRSVACSPDGKIVASAGQRLVHFWDRTSGQSLGAISPPVEEIWSMAFAPDGKTLAIGGATSDHQGQAALIDMESRKVRTTLPMFRHTVMALCFTADSTTLATGTAPYDGAGANPYTRLIWIQPAKVGQVQLWDASSGQLQRTLEGQLAGVLSLAVSPDGQQLVAGCWDRSLRVWELPTGELRSLLDAHDGYVWSVAFSPDGKLLASGSGKWDGAPQVKLWDLPAMRERARLHGHAAGVTAVAFAPDSKTLASASWDRTIKLWDIESQTQRQTLIGHRSYLSSLAFTPDGELLISGSWDQTVRLWYTDETLDQTVWSNPDVQGYSLAFSADSKSLLAASDTCQVIDLQAGQVRKLFSANTADVSVARSPDGKRIAYGGINGKATIREAESGDILWKVDTDSPKIWSLAFAPNSHVVAAGCEDGSVHIWDVDQQSKIGVLQGSGRAVRWVTFSPDGQLLVAACHRAGQPLNSDIKIWDTGKWEVKHMITPSSGGAHTSLIECVAFTPDGKTMISAGHDKTAKVWDTRTWRLRETLKGHLEVIYHLAISPDGKTLATASWDGTVKLWHIETGQLLSSLGGHQGVVYSVAFSPDGRMLAAGSGLRLAGRPARRRIKFYHALPPSATAEERPAVAPLETLPYVALEQRAAAVTALAHAPDGRLLASGDRAGQIVIESVEGDQQPLILAGHRETVSALSFSPDGKQLASASSDGSAMLWDAIEGQQQAALCKDSGELYAIAFSPDGKLIAVAGEDKAIALFDAATTRQVDTLRGHGSVVSCLAFSPDGRLLFSGSWDNSVRVWDVATRTQGRTLSGHKWGVTCLAYSPGRRLLAAGTGFGNPGIALWDLDTGTLKATLLGHSSEMESLAFVGKNGQWLVSINQDRSLRVWKMDAPRALEPLLLHDAVPLACSVHPHQSQLAIGDHDGSILLVDIADHLRHVGPMQAPAAPRLPPALNTKTAAASNPLEQIRQLLLPD